MAFEIGAVVLPRFPEKIQFRKAADIKTYRYPGALPLIIGFGNKADVLIIDGRLQEAGVTKANIVINYVSPLEALVNTEVVIDCDGRSYDDTTFVFVNFTYDERPGWARAFYFRAEFWKGSEHMVL